MHSFALSRFVDAQAGSYEAALREITAGRKQSHWIWYIFPQIAGLGQSPMARHYALSGLDEARAFLSHPVLGPRLVEISSRLLRLSENNPTAVMGAVDDLKLRSSMTLFHLAAPENKVFSQVLAKFYGGEPDPLTVKLAGKQ